MVLTTLGRALVGVVVSGVSGAPGTGGGAAGVTTFLVVTAVNSAVENS